VRTRRMTAKQLQVYGARIRLAWFRKADELGSVVTACKYYGIPRSEYYYWHSRWLASGTQLTSLYDQPRGLSTIMCKLQVFNVRSVGCLGSGR
jgi:hypothetical protein